MHCLEEAKFCWAFSLGQGNCENNMHLNCNAQNDLERVMCRIEVHSTKTVCQEADVGLSAVLKLNHPFNKQRRSGVLHFYKKVNVAHLFRILSGTEAFLAHMFPVGKGQSLGNHRQYIVLES